MAKTSRPITCTVNAQEQKGRRKNPLIKQYGDSPKKAIHSLNDRHSSPFPSEPPCITRCMCSGHVRLDLMSRMLVTRIRLLPHKPRLSPNAFALSHLTTTTTRQTYIRFPRQRTTQLAYSKTPRNVQETIVYTQSPASFNTHLSTVLTSHHQQKHSAAKKRLISSRH